MITVNDVFELWCDLKRGLKHNNFQNYKYMYNIFVRPTFGKLRIANVRKSDVKRFYNRLADDSTPVTMPKCRTDTKGYILCCKNGSQRQLETIGVLYT